MVNYSHLIAAIVGVVLFFGAAWFGSAANREAWQDDCEKLGAHRSVDTVYKCEKASTKEGKSS